MPDVDDLIVAQFVALGIGAFFATVEYARLKPSTLHRSSWAMLEGIRMWGFIAITETAIWYALRNRETAVWIALGVLAPVAAALIFNNLHIFLHRKMVSERAQ